MDKQEQTLEIQFGRFALLQKELGRIAGLANHLPEMAGQALFYLTLEPEISVQDFSYLMDMRGQELDKLLYEMKDWGFINLTQNKDDRQKVIIRLTEAGVSAAVGCSVRQNLFTCLDKTEQDEMKKYLNRLVSWTGPFPGDGNPDTAEHEEEKAGRYAGYSGGGFPFSLFETFMPAALGL
ncbi:MarR family winged helix-turn-helix transcriptional regulator [Brucepastera parasyntrophica]|uniref:MarR family winged helix-turn-helix transcriptional regulator n=1 Tax=Brucepastera parasyntrophica TaxID=2880008 RepID=UPI00210D30B8|nr:MarR family winged helix-turn-helix transcriptional regulator [Brucepastera parasyntrophica]ULQ59294.1 MarR family winged helix-turn-helix transcriptional regulator [Brucepastera parasyntrophica]